MRFLSHRHLTVLVLLLVSFCPSQSYAYLACTSVISSETGEVIGSNCVKIDTNESNQSDLWVLSLDAWRGSHDQDFGAFMNKLLESMSGHPTSTEGPESTSGITDCPVIVKSGEKYFDETDYIGTGEMPLKINRKYSSNNSRVGIFGTGWVSDFDVGLQIHFDSPVGNYCLHSFLKPTPEDGCFEPYETWGGIEIKELVVEKGGVRKKFTQSNERNIFLPADQVDRNFSKGNYNSKNYISVTDSVGLGRPTYRYVDDRRVSYNFGEYGVINQIADQIGGGWRFERYDDSYGFIRGAIKRVVHIGSGRALTFSWIDRLDNRVLDSITLPNGKTIKYVQDSKRLPASYESFLTGIYYPENTGSIEHTYTAGREKSIDGEVWGKYILSVDRKVAYSGLVDGVKVSHFDYSENQTVVTNAKGGSKVFKYDEYGRLFGVDRDASDLCPSAASELHYADDDPLAKPEYKVDWLGVRTSFRYYSDGQVKYEYSKGITKEYVWSDIGQPKRLSIWDGAVDPALCAVGEKCPSPRSLPSVVMEYGYLAVATPDLGRLSYVISKALKYNSLEYTPERRIDYSYQFRRDASTGVYVMQQMVVDGPKIGGEDIEVYNYTYEGDLKTVIDVNGGVTEYFYSTDDGGLPSKKIDPNQLVTVYKYDARGRTVSITVDSQSTTQFEYYGGNELKKITYPDGSYKKYEIDSARRVSKITRPILGAQAVETSIEYDLLSNPTFSAETFVANNGNRVRGRVLYDREYDQFGYLSVVKGQADQSVAYTYTADGQIKSETDATGRVSVNRYDEFGRIKSITNAENETMFFGYDRLGYLEYQMDARYNTTYYRRNGFGEVEILESPDTGVTVSEYNEFGVVDSQVKQNGIAVRVEYDSKARPLAIESSGSAFNRSIQYHYNVKPAESPLACENGIGRLCGFTDDSGYTSYSYNKVGGVTDIRNSIDGVNFDAQQSYDEFNRPRVVTFPGGVQLRYSYDSGDQTKIEAKVAGVWQTVASRHVGANIEYYILGHGGYSVSAFDPDGRITFNSGANQYSTYKYKDRSDFLDSIVTAGETVTYDYDKVGRLVQTATAEIDDFIEYDKNGNRVYFTKNGVAERYRTSSTDNKLDLLYTSETTSYSYDENGNLVRRSGGDGYTTKHDGFGQLASLDPAGTVGPVSYKYNANKLRVKKSGSSGDYYYLYDRQGRLIAETGKNTTAISSIYIYFGNRIIGLIRENQLYYVETDHLGRPIAITDNAKSVVWQAKPDSFGRAVAFSSIGDFNIGFPGQYYDAESRLWYNWHRYYDSETGRYIQSDPIGLRGGINTYAYVANNPLKYIDPLGLEFRIYSSDAFGIEGINHVYVWSTNESSGIGSNGSSGYTLGDGVTNLTSPYSVVDLRAGLTEKGALDLIRSYPGWNNGLYFPFINDCHNDLEGAFNHAGIPWPGAPEGGRLDPNHSLLNTNLFSTFNAF